MKDKGKLRKRLLHIRLSTILLFFLFLLGVGLILYPSISDYWNSFHQTQAIIKYKESTKELEENQSEILWNEAVAYNQSLSEQDIRWNMSKREAEKYEQLLNINGSGIMGYVEIPKIDCGLPIYHGTEEAVLQVGAGHIAGSSLPVGGTNSHCMISGHRGLPSAKLFTNLDQLEVGDIFGLKVLNETLVYEIDQIKTVLPDDLDELRIVEGEDFCTLVTCTPYGINSHRLLVRGRRTDQGRWNFEEEQEGGGDLKPWYMRYGWFKWVLLGVVIALLVVFISVLGFRKKVSAAECEENDYVLRTMGTITIRSDFSKGEFALYKVAELSENGGYSLTEDFKDSGVTTDKKNSEELGTLAKELTFYVNEKNLSAVKTVTINKSNSTTISELPLGIYLLVASPIEKEGFQYETSPVLIFLPTQIEVDDWGDNGASYWEYDIVIAPKYEKVEQKQQNGSVKEKIDSLPQTGQLWWPVIVLVLLAVLAFTIAKIRGVF